MCKREKYHQQLSRFVSSASSGLELNHNTQAPKAHQLNRRQIMAVVATDGGHKNY
jgi:hypothetical protein